VVAGEGVSDAERARRGHRFARRVFSKLRREVVRITVKLAPARRAWLRAAEAPSRAELRRELVRRRVFPATVTASLASLGVADRDITMVVGSPWDQVAARLWWDDASAYEAPVPGLVAALGRRSRRAIVVGANTGFYCLVLGLQPDGPRVDAVEPWPPAVRRLRENLDLNDVADRVHVWPVAAGSEEGRMPLYVPPPLADDWPFEMSASLSGSYRRHHAETIDVPVTTIDAIRESDATPIDLIVVDAEGFDHEVLWAADRTVASDSPIIFTEVTSDEVDSVNSLLARWGYLAVELSPSCLRVTDRVTRPAHVLGRVRDSATAADSWISAAVRPSRLPELDAAAAACSLPVHGRGEAATP
jgi:FkbM family methyltransferase